MDVYVGLIFPFAGTYAPQGSTQCWGQDVPVQQNQALYSLIGTLYGGNGNPNFKVPDLRGRVMVGAGVSPYLSMTLNPGAYGGTAATTLSLTNFPPHTHAATFTPSGSGGGSSTINATVQIPVSTQIVTSNTPSAGANYLGAIQLNDGGSGFTIDGPYSTTNPTGSGAYLQGAASGTVTIAGGGGTVVVQAGGGQASPVPISNLQPYLAVTMFIATYGLYPMRD